METFPPPPIILNTGRIPICEIECLQNINLQYKLYIKYPRMLAPVCTNTCIYTVVT